MVYKLKIEYIPSVKELRDIKGSKLIKKIESTISIYQLSTPDFDMFHYKSFPVFECYMEGFESKIKDIENDGLTNLKNLVLLHAS